MRVERFISVVVSLSLAGCTGGSVVRGNRNIPEGNKGVLAPKLGPTVCGVEPRGMSNRFCTYGTADTPEGRQAYTDACCFAEGERVVWPFEEGGDGLVAESCIQDRCYFEEKK